MESREHGSALKDKTGFTAEPEQWQITKQTLKCILEGPKGCSITQSRPHWSWALGDRE